MTGTTAGETFALIVAEGLVRNTIMSMVFPIPGFSIPICLEVLEPRAKRNPRYLLTDQRVMIVSGFFGRNVDSLPLNDMTGSKLRMDEHRNGSDTIGFADFKKAYGEDGDMVCMPELDKIPDSRQVVSLIRVAISDLRKKWRYPKQKAVRSLRSQSPGLPRT